MLWFVQTVYPRHKHVHVTRRIELEACPPEGRPPSGWGRFQTSKKIVNFPGPRAAPAVTGQARQDSALFTFLQAETTS